MENGANPWDPYCFDDSKTIMQKFVERSSKPIIDYLLKAFDIPMIPQRADVARALMKRGFFDLLDNKLVQNIDLTDQDGSNYLIDLIRRNDVNHLSQLVKADVVVTMDVMKAAISSCSTAIVKVLISHHVPLHTVDVSSITFQPGHDPTEVLKLIQKH